MLTAFLPSLFALLLSFFIKNAAIALGAGAILGAILVNASHISELPSYLLNSFILQIFESPWKMGAVLLTLQLGALSTLLESNGNIDRIFNALQGQGSQPNRKKSLNILSCMGLICFYDGLANSILLGKISQSLTKKFKVSRALLSYIVDSTSSAVACLVVFSTWTAFQLTLIQDNISPERGSPLSLLIQSIPFNVYSWISLILLFAVIKFDFFIGPMKSLEAKAQNEEVKFDESSSQRHPKQNILIAAFPLIILFVSFIFFVFIDAIFKDNKIFLSAFIEALSSSKVPWLLNLSAVCAIACTLLSRHHPELTLHKSFVLMKNGMIQISAPLLILFSAWALSKTLGDLGLSQLLAPYFSGNSISPQWIPLICFLSSCLVSFITGTSWGTLALMMPIALPIVGQMDPTFDYLLPAVIGAVFGGAVFGDHSSPLSDTTVVSSFATGCSVRDHVRSQMPYALLAALASALLVYLPYAIF